MLVAAIVVCLIVALYCLVKALVPGAKILAWFAAMIPSVLLKLKVDGYHGIRSILVYVALGIVFAADLWLLPVGTMQVGFFLLLVLTMAGLTRWESQA